MFTLHLGSGIGTSRDISGGNEVTTNSVNSLAFVKVLCSLCTYSSLTDKAMTFSSGLAHCCMITLS